MTHEYSHQHLSTLPLPQLLLGSAHWAQQHLQSTPYPLITLHLQPCDANDPIALGNRLSEGIAAAYGSPLFGSGMSFEYGLQVILQNREVLEPLSFLVLHSEYAPALAESLYKHFSPCLWLHFVSPSDWSWLAGAQVVHEPPAEFPNQAAYSGWVNLELLFQRSLAKADWGRALDLLLRLNPPNLVEQLEPIAAKLIEQGECRKLYSALQGLPNPAQQPRLLRWLLEAALQLGEQRPWQETLEQALEQNPTPELRAVSLEVFFYGGQPERALEQTRQAAAEAATPFTLYQWGRALQTKDPQASLEQLRRSLRLAEQKNLSFSCAKACLALAQTHTQLGQFAAAETWAEQGLRWLEQQASSNTLLRLQLFNELAYARILLGQTMGLEEQLRRETSYLQEASPAWARLFRSTLAELLIAEGRGLEACHIYAEIWQQLDRREGFNLYCAGYVRALIECGELEIARQIAEQATGLTHDLPLVHSRNAQLAYALAISLKEPFRGLELLDQCLNRFDVHVADQHLRIVLYQLRALDAIGNYAKAQALLDQHRSQLQTLGLSGLRLLGGPEEWFSTIIRMVTGKEAPLELWYLGQQHTRWQGQPMELRQRLADYLATLVLAPNGITLEKLATEVYADAANTNTTKGQMAQLKKLLPIEAIPYRLNTPYWADFIELRQLVEDGQLRESLRLYKGPLMPESEAKNIENERWYLQEMLRAAVLLSNDAECLWLMANLMRDDLELWEKTHEILKAGDYRKILARGHIRHLSA